MKEVLDVIIWIGFIFLLFVFLRGFNRQQVQKHQDKLEEIEKKKREKQKEEKE
jgi:arginine exporter protein ArgO